MSFLTLKIGGTDKNSIIEDFVYSNSLKGNPTIDINPADVDNSSFAIGNEVQIYNGATKLLAGEIKDLTSLWLQGINTVSSRIHIRDLKEKIFTVDLSQYTGLTNLQALTYICSSVGVTLSTSVTTTQKYAMDKEISSQSFWRFVQDICSSEGWGCYLNETTLYVKNIVSDSSSYTLTNFEQIEHEYNDLNVYSNIIVKGIINKDRLFSDDNPYSDILSYDPLSTLDTFSITEDNRNDFITTLTADAGVENFLINEGNTFSFDLVNATSIDDTYDYNTFTITYTNKNINILKIQKILFDSDDIIAEQCEKVRLTCEIPDENNEISFVTELKGKKIDAYTTNLTPDTFIGIYKDTNYSDISKERYLYYENENITAVSQIQDIISSLGRETARRVLKIKVKVKTDHVFNLYDRLFIDEDIDDIDGYWSVYAFSCNRNVRRQEWLLELVRSNTIIIPDLNIYSKNSLGAFFKNSLSGRFRAIAINEINSDSSDNLNLNSNKSVKCFIPELRKTINALNKSDFVINKGQNCFVQKMSFSDNWVILSVANNELLNNLSKIQYFEADSSVIDSFNGGYNTTFLSDWNTSGIADAPNTKPYNFSENSISIVSASKTYMGETGTYLIKITTDENIDAKTVDLSSIIL